MKKFLQEWRSTASDDLKFMFPIIDELIAMKDLDMDAAVEYRRAYRDSHERFSVEYMFQWSVLTYLEDINSRYKLTAGLDQNDLKK